MVLTRSSEDVFELLEHASSDTKTFFKTAQLLTFGDNPFDEDVFLMEVSSALADQFLSNPLFNAEIKSKDGNDDENPAFFCTGTSTQRLLETETSDILLLVPGLKIPGEVEDRYWLTETSSVSNRIVTAMKSFYIEPTSVRSPSLCNLKQRLLPSNFAGHIEDEDQDISAFDNFFTLDDLRKSVPCSELELFYAMDRLNVFSWKGQCRMFQLDYLTNALQSIFDMADELSINWLHDGFSDPKDIIHRLRNLYPPSVLCQVFQRFFLRKRSSRNNTAEIYPRKAKICRLIGENLLSITKKFALSDFISVWCASVPHGMQPKLNRDLISSGRAYTEISSLTQQKSITYLPSEDLPDESVDVRLKSLFERQPRWPQSQLAGYVADLIVDVPIKEPCCRRLSKISDCELDILSDSEDEEEQSAIADEFEDVEKVALDNPAPISAVIGSVLNHHCRVTTSADGLFSPIYGDLFLSSFRLRPCSNFRKWIEAFSLCNSLSTLNLDSCYLGQKYPDVLPWIAKIKGLKFLSLRWNNLTNDHILSVTAKWRFKEIDEDCKLTVVDVSSNPFLGERALKKLTSISSLQMIYLSDTGLAVSTSALPLGWEKRTDRERLVPQFPEPSGWLWEDFGAMQFSLEENLYCPQYECPFIVFRLRTQRTVRKIRTSVI
nr:sister chromatid cohesion protein dcc1 [Hymenolepis microstoma]